MHAYVTCAGASAPPTELEQHPRFFHLSLGTSSIPGKDHTWLSINGDISLWLLADGDSFLFFRLRITIMYLELYCCDDMPWFPF